ncbi:hypothetical protein [Pelagicoccus sp. SDUM812005]|uniref:hypothetical protein n=1 Tax=Pelagicoccus sp. SDUM812005 TaxID=3041257 RepID=UPI00280E3514|nr:hypothetical protein [Pelagicoccus sp. SDUM812005]MDQ8180307.1 hypothetical protein [Pelagicoccus sp. SDUM812005]
MKLDMITKFGSRAFLGAASLFCVSTAQAISYSFTIQESDIKVGETFDVAFTATFDADYFLDYFAFDVGVDPVTLTSSSGMVRYLGASVNGSLFDTSFLSEVSALGDTPAFAGGTDLLLATLSFEALAPGSESVSLSGALNDFAGIVVSKEAGPGLFDFNVIESDIEARLDVRVSAVPDSPLYGAVPVLLIGMLAFHRKRS